jgi:hypothetical protein
VTLLALRHDDTAWWFDIRGVTIVFLPACVQTVVGETVTLRALRHDVSGSDEMRCLQTGTLLQWRVPIGRLAATQACVQSSC